MVLVVDPLAATDAAAAEQLAARLCGPRSTALVKLKAWREAVAATNALRGAQLETADTRARVQELIVRMAIMQKQKQQAMAVDAAAAAPGAWYTSAGPLQQRGSCCRNGSRGGLCAAWP